MNNKHLSNGSRFQRDNKFYNSLVNDCTRLDIILVSSAGSSTDQDSLAYRFGDTDSGLGRATPPRRAPSPGMSMRHLPSPSGPGSLPGLMSKGRRMFDDGSSDISSTPSSMMDYNGKMLFHLFDNVRNSRDCECR